MPIGAVRMFLIRQRGFTLIELLVVISIIGTLAAMLLPAIATVRSRAFATTCMNNMRQIGIASYGYAVDYNDAMVPGCQSRDGTSAWNAQDYWQELIWPYLDGKVPSGTAGTDTKVSKVLWGCPTYRRRVASGYFGARSSNMAQIAGYRNGYGMNLRPGLPDNFIYTALTWSTWVYGTPSQRTTAPYIQGVMTFGNLTHSSERPFISEAWFWYTNSQNAIAGNPLGSEPEHRHHGKNHVLYGDVHVGMATAIVSESKQLNPQ